jgi:hypothetical protein
MENAAGWLVESDARYEWTRDEEDRLERVSGLFGNRIRALAPERCDGEGWLFVRGKRR